MSLFSAVSAEAIRAAQIVSGLTMAAFIAAGVVPGLRERASAIRGALLVLYLAACCAFAIYVLVR